MEVKGKVVLVTGAAHGIGKATAFQFACEGARLVIADIHQGRLEEAVAELREAGYEALPIVVDLREKEQVDRMVDQAIEEMGRLDILVNNAGIVFAKKIMDIEEREIRNMLLVNLHAPIWSIKRALPHMLERRSGYIVNLCSAAGKTTNAYLSVYCSTKFGMVGLTDAVHQELHGTGIKTLAVNPGWIQSGMFKGSKPIRFVTRWKPPSYVARAIVYAVQRNKAEIHRPRIMWFGALLRSLLGPRIMAKGWRLFRGDRLFSRTVGYE